MKRVDCPEILDTDACSPEDVQASLRDIHGINRRFGGVTTTRTMIERVTKATGQKHFSLLEAAAGSGEGPRLVAEQLARQGISIDITLLDRSAQHLPRNGASITADALAMPFPDNTFDLASCVLFAHHLHPGEVVRFVQEALRVSRKAVLINDLVRSPIHLAFVYAARPWMESWVSRADGVASVRRAYTPREIKELLTRDGKIAADQIEITRHFLYRMGIIVWKEKDLKR